ncbi:MAG: hypothetical protein IT373_09155 [Polyangiaceae bacterium]|nr:hypothetical protein [Polyangiaceae bacterium]
MARRFAAFLVASVALFSGARAAEARSTQDSPYTYEQTFGTTLRLLTVDLGYKITEKDAEWGYLLFEYDDPTGSKQKPRGSFELVRADGNVRVVVQIPAVPSYHEQLLLDKLKRKLEADHGTPPKREKPPKKPKDGDKDKPDGDRPKDGDKPKDGAPVEPPKA